MKRKSLSILLLITVISIISCGKKQGEGASSDETPSPVKTVAEAKSIMTGKKWSVTDVALKPYEFGNDKNLTISYDWFSVAKDLGEFEKKEESKFLNSTIELSADTTAVTSGIGLVGLQKYLLTDIPVEGKSEGIRLELSGNSNDEDFKDMEMTYTYYVLGANDKRLLLQTPNSINNRPVVLMLEIK
ncbi:hypothetical protein BH09BAC3_BH09BAC3_34560 [soil metagenome]